VLFYFLFDLVCIDSRGDLSLGNESLPGLKFLVGLVALPEDNLILGNESLLGLKSLVGQVALSRGNLILGE
jgi:hypothetical protein